MKNCYIHIPFCSKICSYCDFCKMFYNKKFVSSYLEALDREIYDVYRGVNLVNSNDLYLDGARDSKVENVGSSALIYPGGMTAGILLTSLRSVSSGICPNGISGIYFSS